MSCTRSIFSLRTGSRQDRKSVMEPRSLSGSAAASGWCIWWFCLSGSPCTDDAETDLRCKTTENQLWNRDLFLDPQLHPDGVSGGSDPCGIFPEKLYPSQNSVTTPPELPPWKRSSRAASSPAASSSVRTRNGSMYRHFSGFRLWTVPSVQCSVSGFPI